MRAEAPGGRWDRFIALLYIDFDSQSRDRPEPLFNRGLPEPPTVHGRTRCLTPWRGHSAAGRAWVPPRHTGTGRFAGALARAAEQSDRRGGHPENTTAGA